MKAWATTRSALGFNCWLPMRFVGHCHQCQRFTTCTYPEKKVAPEIQAKLDQIAAHRAAIKEHAAEVSIIEEDIKPYQKPH